MTTKRSTKGLPDSELTPAELEVRNKQRATAAANRSMKTTKSAPLVTKSGDEEDFLDEAVTFYHHNFRHIDFGYTNNRNQTITPPGGETEMKDGKPINYVRFEQHERKSVPDPQGKGHIAKCSCKYTTHSKKMAKYFRDHPAYGVTIHETKDSVYSLAPSVADIMEQTAQKLVGLTNNDIVARANSMGIPINADLTITRRRILEKMASDVVSKSFEQQKKVAGPVKTEGDEKATAKAY